jgi:hypothetical protein
VSEIVFEEPPQDGRRTSGRDHAGIARSLKDRPGEWAKIYTSETSNPASTSAWQIRAGLLVPYRPAGAFEAVSRKVDGKYRVYARFVGGSDG